MEDQFNKTTVTEGQVQQLEESNPAPADSTSHSDQRREAVLMDIPIEKLVRHPQNPRLFPRVEVINTIKCRLVEQGYFSKENTLLVRPITINNEISYQIVNGHHRLDGALLAKISMIPCWVKEMSDEEAYLELALANSQSSLTPLEIGLHALHIPKGKRGRGHKGAQAVFRDQLGLSPQYLSVLLDAAEVYAETQNSSSGWDFHGKTAQLSKIKKAPSHLWAALCEAVARLEWSVAETQKWVRKLKDAFPQNSEPITFEMLMGYINPVVVSDPENTGDENPGENETGTSVEESTEIFDNGMTEEISRENLDNRTSSNQVSDENQGANEATILERGEDENPNPINHTETSETPVPVTINQENQIPSGSSLPTDLDTGMKERLLNEVPQSAPQGDASANAGPSPSGTGSSTGKFEIFNHTPTTDDLNVLISEPSSGNPVSLHDTIIVPLLESIARIQSLVETENSQWDDFIPLSRICLTPPIAVSIWPKGTVY